MTETIKEQILAIRGTGLTNMFGIPMVQRLAYERDFYDLVLWLEDHKKEYVRFIMYGEEYSKHPAACGAGFHGSAGRTYCPNKRLKDRADYAAYRGRIDLLL